MKKLMIPLVILLAGSAYAQENMQTLFSPGKSQLTGAYGAARINFSQMHGQPATLLGGYGGALFDKQWMLGAGAYTLLNGMKISICNDPNTHQQLTYIGLVGEYMYQPNKALHLVGHLLAGGASIGRQISLDGQGDYSYTTGGALVLEPGAGIEINITRWFRTDAGATYRWIIDEPEISAASIYVSLKFGKF
jgi:hypothetical protein